MHHKDLEQCAAELKIANARISTGANDQLKRKDELNIDLENMMFTISHKVRKSVADIIGISKILCDDIDVDLHEFKEMLGIIIQSAESLNLSTEELSKLIHDNKQN